MKKKNFNLAKQLIFIIIVIFAIIIVGIGYLLPKVLLPVYENNLYTILRHPLEFIVVDFARYDFDSNVAYIYVNADGSIINSTNLTEVIDVNLTELMGNIVAPSGKFTYNRDAYYYISVKENNMTKIALTDDSYINNIRDEILNIIFPILFFTLLIVVGLVLLWSQLLIRKIERLKEKIDNLDNENYNKKFNYVFEDELYSLSNSIDDMKETLRLQDEYKNQMYQNISHDFKTPLTVIKSYVEGIEDGIEAPETGISVIKEQIDKLELKVHSLLYLNKINYLKEIEDIKKDKTDVAVLLKTAVDKFKMSRLDINWEVKVIDKKTDFYGTTDMWEAIIDNLLNNFIRYAEKSIVITIKNNKIILFNDGPNIDANILNDIFTPYKKGIKGEFGLGLSIVKKTISLIGYEISVRNEKKGVSFIINK